MMGLLAALTLVSLGELYAPLPLAHPDTLGDMQGLRLEPRLPDETKVLIERAAGNDSLWYSPSATRMTPEGVEIWYQRVEKTLPEYMDQRVLCLGVLQEDGHFELPSLCPEAPAWGGPNNVVMRRSPHKPTWGGFNVFQMTQQADELVMLYWDQPTAESEAGAMLARSKDGWNWKQEPGAVFTEHNDAYTLMKLGEKWVLYQTMLEDWPDKPYKDNLGLWRRVQCIRESEDLVHWSPQAPLLRPDAQDPPTTEFYLMKVFPYQEMYLGLLMKYFSDPAKPNEHSGIIVNELMISADARRWERPWRDVDIGFWSYADPFQHDAKTKFATWKDNALVTMGYVNGAMLAVVADEEGSFLTPPVEGHGLRVMSDTREGWIEITPELNGSPIEGFPAKRLAEGVEGYRVWRTHEGMVEAHLSWEKKLPPGTRLRFVVHRARLIELAISTFEVG